MESEFSVYSKTDTATRTQELTNLLWQFIEFKSRLERQEEVYSFWWVIPGLVFQDESMEGLPDQCPADGIVEICLWPLLVRSHTSREGNTVVGKAVVKITSHLAYSMRNESAVERGMDSSANSTEECL